MPKLLLTKRNIDSKKHVPPVEAGRVDYFDTEVKGLLLRVGKESKTSHGRPHCASTGAEQREFGLLIQGEGRGHHLSLFELPLRN